MNKNLPFITSTKMADVIHRDYTLIPLVSRFGIDYGFGNKTIQEVCEKHDINVWFFLEIINSYHNPEYFPKKQLQNFSAELIINYLKRTHQYYRTQKVPEIQLIIDELEAKVIPENYNNIKLLSDFFKSYQQELFRHLDREDDRIFPYILSLENALESGDVGGDLIEKIQNDPIEHYETNHDDVEVKLSDLKNLILMYLPPVLCKELCQKLLMELFRLEKDLKNHSGIEDKVLIPKVKMIEKKIIDLSERG